MIENFSIVVGSSVVGCIVGVSVVGILMVSSLSQIEWSKFEVAVPAFFTMIMMPLTSSIATGLAVGFVFYPLTMVLKGKAKEVNPIMYIFAVIFLIYLSTVGSM